jgi:glycosyltransferase involved in cell wall biosynthesis
MAMTTICVFGAFPPSLTHFRGDLLRALRRRGRACAIAGENDTLVRKQLADWSVDFQVIPVHRTGINPIFDLLTFLKLCLFLGLRRPQSILAYTAKPVIYGMLAAHIAGVPRRVAMITGLGYAFSSSSRSRLFVRTLLCLLYRISLRSSHLTLFQNRDDMAEFIRLNIVPATKARLVAGSGINLQQFSQRPLPSGPTTFLLVSRLIFDKGIAEYVQAARLVRQTHPQARFRLVGPLDSNPTAVSEQQLLEWVAEGVLEWPRGWQDARAEMAACHVYVLPTLYREGVPRTILEAMAIGRAVITSDAPGCRDTVVEGVNGFLVPLRDAGRLADAMRMLVENPEMVYRMGIESRRFAEEKYNVHRVNAHVMMALGLRSRSKSTSLNQPVRPTKHTQAP